MNTNRLLVLGMLSIWGPMHGHQIRRSAGLMNAEAWSDVRAGALYSAINRVRDEGLIEPVRTEREGNLPQRTVYRITDEGERELYALLNRGLRELKPSKDPFDMALSMSFEVPQDELEEVVLRRRKSLSATRERLVEERERLAKKGFLTTVAFAIFRHAEHRVEADLRWHGELLELLPNIAAGARDWREKRAVLQEDGGGEPENPDATRRAPIDGGW